MEINSSCIVFLAWSWQQCQEDQCFSGPFLCWSCMVSIDKPARLIQLIV